MLKVSVIIPNYNGIHYLRLCLSSLSVQTFKSFEVIVVDNGSRDGSAEFLKKEYPSVKLIVLTKNTGFAKACNIGIEASKGEYIAVLNNDTEVTPQWITSLVDTAKKSERIGMVASKIILSCATHQIDSVGMLIYRDGIGRQKGRGEIDNGQYDCENEILFPSACAALYKKEMLDEIGLFDEDFFAYCEDTDLGLRGRAAGWEAVFSPQAVVYHKYSITKGKYSSFKAVHIERNRIWVAVKNFPLTWLLKMPYYTIKRYILQTYSIIVGRGSSSKFKETHKRRDVVLLPIKSYFCALIKMPLMLKKRKNIKRVLSNREFTSILNQHLISTSELVLKD